MLLRDNKISPSKRSPSQSKTRCFAWLWKTNVIARHEAIPWLYRLKDGKTVFAATLDSTTVTMNPNLHHPELQSPSPWTQPPSSQTPTSLTLYSNPCHPELVSGSHPAFTPSLRAKRGNPLASVQSLPPNLCHLELVTGSLADLR